MSSQNGEGNGSKRLDVIFKPSSVAVIGASRGTGSIGYQILDNLVTFGFSGKLFPINPFAEAIHSFKCYPSVLDVPDPVDLAIIVVPKDKVPGVVDECGEKGVGGLVVISAGFKEVGGEGIEREQRLLEQVRSYGMSMIGPNCMGVFNADPEIALHATFSPTHPPPGDVAFMSQSGALGVAILNVAREMNIGFSFFASVGNKADIAGNDLLAYWEDDPGTRVIALYLESFGDPRVFTVLARRIARKKPLVVVKSGRSEAGARAASSHTGALAGRDVAIDALLNQCGVLRARSIEEMFNTIQAFTRCPLPDGNRICILTNAGGPAILATDACEEYGLEMARLTDETSKQLSKILPAEASVLNPVDMIASANHQTYRVCLELVLQDPEVDIVMVIFVPPTMINPTDVATAVTEVTRRHKKPVVGVFMALEEFYEQLQEKLPDHPPLFFFPEPAARTCFDLCKYSQLRRRPEGVVPVFDVDRERSAEIMAAAKKDGGGFLMMGDVFDLLKAYGIPTCRMGQAREAGDTGALARSLGFPVAVKAAGRGIVHKSDVGAVALDLRSEDDVSAAVKQIGENLESHGLLSELEGFVVQEMTTRGQEVIIGMSSDPLFGPLLMFGLGGRYVEVFKDVVFRPVPVTDVDAWEMVESVKGLPLLKGVRGEQGVDLPLVVEVLHRVSQMVMDFQEIAELDINPFMACHDPSYSRVVDARIRIEAPE
ncbi:MAG: acetate--CoA ligase family protein [Candidatus Eisenbacteria sp.]|nr:acetate--CoA ligase family protein [Candidatus Eisenbacteria bacterium]